MLTKYIKPAFAATSWEAGLAIFSMFFGAGNVIFPLLMGRDAGYLTWLGLIGLMITAVGAPLLGLFGAIMYNGDAGKFYFRIGKIPGLILMIMGLAILGPLAVMPRCFQVTHAAILPYFPSLELLPATIMAGVVTMLCIYRRDKVLAVLGYVLSPALVISLFLIIGFALFNPAHQDPMLHVTRFEAFKMGFDGGYDTLDLISSVFYCAATWALLKLQKEKAHVQNKTYSIVSTSIWASIIAAALLALIYFGLALASARHNMLLMDMPRERVLIELTLATLPSQLAVLANVAIALACLTTAVGAAVTIADVVCDEVEKSDTFKHIKIPYITMSLVMVVLSVLMANLGFEGLMSIIHPMALAIYPAIIVLTITNMIFKVYNIDVVKPAVFATVALTLVIQYQHLIF
jgi:LIVCS family branched-chain amino acid:cation transporter